MIPDYIIQDLTPETDLKSFKCADSDLNDFLWNEAMDYQTELLAKTYLIMNTGTGELMAFFSLLNDTIRLEETDKSTANRINRKIPNSKRRKHYPALKIGRLAVDSRYAGMGVGEEILNTICTMFRYENRTGCRFLTVDALASATGFYQAKGDFRFFSDADASEETRLMYYDLKDFE